MHQDLHAAPGAGSAPARRGRGALLRDAIPAICLAIFLVVWIAVAVNPRYRLVWALENLPVVVLVPAVLLARRRLGLGPASYVLMTVFLIAHTIGSCTSYSEAPIGAWVARVFGWERNPYDRIIHLLFGLLMLHPLREFAFPPGRRRGALAEIGLAFALVGCASAVYEILEWVAVLMAESDLGRRLQDLPAAGAAFVASQGDFWDAQKDMALACAGAVLAGLASWRLRASCPGR